MIGDENPRLNGIVRHGCVWAGWASSWLVMSWKLFFSLRKKSSPYHFEFMACCGCVARSLLVIAVLCHHCWFAVVAAALHTLPVQDPSAAVEHPRHSLWAAAAGVQIVCQIPAGLWCHRGWHQQAPVYVIAIRIQLSIPCMSLAVSLYCRSLLNPKRSSRGSSTVVLFMRRYSCQWLRGCCCLMSSTGAVGVTGAACLSRSRRRDSSTAVDGGRRAGASLAGAVYFESVCRGGGVALCLRQDGSRGAFFANCLAGFVLL